jgi:predicted cupin superfamily sugar epimerase
MVRELLEARRHRADGTADLTSLPDLRGDASAAEVVAALDLAPHPEGGFYRETFRAPPETPGARGAATAILFLLPEGVVSHWHEVDACEIWLWQAGAALRLETAIAGQAVAAHRLGPDLGAGETLQQTVATHEWQRAWSLGGWTLVSCVVAPAFDFVGFRMAPPGWHPETA